VVRQVLTECLVLAVAGGAAGAVLAAAGVTLVKELASVEAPGIFRLFFGASILPRGHEVGIDVKMFGIAFSIAALTSLVFGVLPALHLSRTRQLPAMASRGGGGGRGESRIRGALVVGQLLLATVLLVGAGLLSHSFVKLSTVERGYDPSNVLAFQLVFPPDYTIARKTNTIESLLTRLRAMPGVASAGFTRAGVLIPESVAPDPLGGNYTGIVLLDLNIKYSFDLWGGKRAKWEAALGQARAAEVDAQAARLMLSSDIAHAYAALAQAFAAHDVAIADQDRSSHLLELGRQRVKAGIDNQLQLRQAESSVASAQQQAQAAQQQIDALRNAIAALLGKGPDREGLGQARDALEKDVPTGQQPDEDPFEHRVLADDHPADLEQDRLGGGAGVSGVGERAQVGLRLLRDGLAHDGTSHAAGSRADGFDRPGGQLSQRFLQTR